MSDYVKKEDSIKKDEDYIKREDALDVVDHCGGWVIPYRVIKNIPSADVTPVKSTLKGGSF